MLRLRALPLQLLVLALLAGLAALVANATASPARRLSWIRTTLPVAAPPPTPASAPGPTPLAGPEPAPPAAVKPRTTHAPTAPGPAAPEPPTSVAQSPIREIGGDEAWRAFQAGAAFLDARRSADYEAGHVQGAWCLPIWESDLEDRLLLFQARRRPGPDDPLVLYCSGGSCQDSHLLAARLLKEGYRHLLIYADGFPSWVAQGRPVAKEQP
jgi:rhodanese-related sulfurtransferase